jgi:two-component system chemotaxis response regulator CheY
MGKRIMIVDDSASTRGMLRITLQSAGYDVVEACDGQDALSKLAGKTFDLILSDLNMPRMNGRALAQAVRRDPAHRKVPIVVLSTEAEADATQGAHDDNVQVWLRKPFKPDALISAISRLV